MAYKLLPFPTILGTSGHRSALKNKKNMGFRGEIKLKHKKSSPIKVAGAGVKAGVDIIGGLAQGIGAWTQRAGLKDAVHGEGGTEELYDAARQNYLNMNFGNPYAGMTNPFTNAENTYEDLGVGMQGEQFRKQQQQEAMGGAMEQFRGAAGSSGVGGMVQAMVRQQQQAAAQSGAEISGRERQNEMARAGQAGKIQELQGTAEMTRQRYIGQGEILAQQREQEKLENLFSEAGINKAASMQALAQNTQDIWGGFGKSVGGAVGAGAEGYGPDWWVNAMGGQ